MKSTFPILFLFPILLSAQNWSPLNIQDKYNFQAISSNYISNTIWVDSTKVINGDSVFYHNRIVKDCPACDPSEPELYKIANQGQFLQKQATRRLNGDYYFEGDQNFLLKTNATLNDSWTFDTLQNIEATIIEVSEQDIFGNMDSIKIALLSNLDTITFSKNFGILRFKNQAEDFVMVGIEGRNLGELTPDFSDFYDFEEGDVFQYQINSFSFSGWRSGIRKINIQNKLENDSQYIYTIYEIRSDTLETPLGGYEYTYNSNTYDQTFNTQLNWRLNQKFNKQIIQDDIWGPYCNDPSEEIFYRVLELSKDSNNGRVSKGTGAFPSSPNYNAPQGYHFIDNGSDTLIQTSCVFDFYYIYTEGLGEVYKWESIIDNTVKSRLISYVKGGDTTGIITPDEDLLLANNDIQIKNNLSIQPNPSTGVYQVNFDSSTRLFFELVNINGEVILMTKTDELANSLEIDIETQPSGVYFLKVRDEKSFYTYKLLKL